MLNFVSNKISDTLKLTGKTGLCREEHRLNLGCDFFQRMRIQNR